MPTTELDGGGVLVVAAAPKSISLVAPAYEIITFSGLTSRWTKPTGTPFSVSAWPYDSARTTSSMARRKNFRGSRRCLRRNDRPSWRSDRPGTYSIAMK